jgi:hypothetical protein
LNRATAGKKSRWKKEIITKCLGYKKCHEGRDKKGLQKAGPEIPSG